MQPYPARRRMGVAEKPIIFSGPMVRAILAGRKTMTRRVLKSVGDADRVFQMNDGSWHVCDSRGGNMSPVTIPYAVGDRLWVREACRAEELSRPQFERKATAQERRIMKRTHVFESSEFDGADGVRYLADDFWAKIENTPAAGEAWHDLYHYRGLAGKKGIGANVPPIHMPRWASRITLAVIAVKVERVQDISGADAVAEGMPSHGPNRPQDDFRNLWNTLHGPGAWDRNDWVTAISFERVA